MFFRSALSPAALLYSVALVALDAAGRRGAAAMATAAATAIAATVPARMELSASLRAALPALLDDARLAPLAFEDDAVAQRRRVVVVGADGDGDGGDATVSLRAAARAQAGTHGSVCFLVRRPGCVLCREHGRQLADRAGDLPLWAVVKETGVDDDGLAEFHDAYFPFPTYKDGARAIYAAMGNRRIGLTTWNPLRLYRGFKEMGQRLKEKNIAGNFAGEGMIQGGVLIFDASGDLKYAYEEEVGSELEVDDILAAVQSLQDGPMAETDAKSEL